MKLWLVLRSFGVANLRNFIRSHVGMAQLFQELVGGDNRFEIVAPRNFAVVCFRVLPSASGLGDGKANEGANELNRKLLESINASGQLYVSHGMVAGIYFIRFAVGATLTEDRHVIAAWKVVQEKLDGILATS